MKAIILAAGRGSRMKNMTKEMPKCLLKIRGKSLLERQLEAIRKAGITDIAIVTGYKHKLIEKYNLYNFHNKRWAETNMVYSLSCAKSWLENNTCIISYSDIFYSHNAIVTLIKSETDIAITYDPNWLKLWKKRFSDPLKDAETFQVNSKNLLIEIGNKPKSISEIKGQYMGLLRFTPKGWYEITRVRSNFTKEKYENMHLTSMLQEIVKAKIVSIKAHEYLELWGEIDTPNDCLIYENEFFID